MPVRGGDSHGWSSTQGISISFSMSWFSALLLAECANRETLFVTSPMASGLCLGHRASPGWQGRPFQLQQTIGR